MIHRFLQMRNASCIQCRPLQSVQLGTASQFSLCSTEKADEPRRGSRTRDKSALRVASAKANLLQVSDVSTYSSSRGTRELGWAWQ
jgi:hypothetical protein